LINFLKAFTEVADFVASGSKFQSLVVLGKKDVALEVNLEERGLRSLVFLRLYVLVAAAGWGRNWMICSGVGPWRSL